MPQLLQANRQGRITTPFGGADAAVLLRFTASERMSEPYTVIADVIVTEGEADLQSHLGAKISIEIFAVDASRKRCFHGRLWEVAQLGMTTAGAHYRLTLKPWASFLDINCESRIYQKQTVQEIVEAVIGRAGGLSPKFRFALGGTYPKLEYVVQWQESDFDFISRLFERHGIYYYFVHSKTDHEMVITDQKLHHTVNPGLGTAITVLPRTEGAERPEGAIWLLAKRFEVAPIKATVTDYEFTTPSQALTANKSGIAKTAHDNSGLSELYVHPGGFNKATGQARGAKLAEHIIEAARSDAERSVAEGDVFAAAVGSTIEIKPQGGTAAKYLITGTTHVYAGGNYGSGGSDDEILTAELEMIPATVQYRPAMKTPRPRIYGPQTAIVAGPAGDEISTDEHGRIMVHFHWDRVQQGGATSSCWIRVMQSVAGNQWGGFTLPRIGQEVVVEYLGGDPDQPIVTGSVYNGTNKPPYALPANKTRTTFKSRSTPNSAGFNEFRMEDKAGSEEVFFNAEKDLNSIIDKGNETRTLNKGNRTTTIKAGDETLVVQTGKRTQTIKGDDTLTIETGNRKETIKTGNDTLAIEKGNREASLDMGNDDVTLKIGNQTVKIKLGKQDTEAMQSITFKVGQSKLVIDQTGITMTGMMIKTEGKIMVETKGLIVQSNGSAMSVLKGGVVMIN